MSALPAINNAHRFYASKPTAFVVTRNIYEIIEPIIPARVEVALF